MGGGPRPWQDEPIRMKVTKLQPLTLVAVHNVSIGDSEVGDEYLVVLHPPASNDSGDADESKDS